MTELEKQINLVVEAREKAGESKLVVETAYAEWLLTNKAIIEAGTATKTTCQEAEATLREMALATYSETGEKQVAPGVGIRVRQVLDYDNEDAMNWAIKHTLALKLDNSAFEKIVKTSPDGFSFVKITEEPQATIATELQVIE